MYRFRCYLRSFWRDYRKVSDIDLMKAVVSPSKRERRMAQPVWVDKMKPIRDALDELNKTKMIFDGTSIPLDNQLK